MSKNDIVINKYNINHRSARRLFRVNSSIDYELGNSDRDNFYEMTDGAEGEYEDVYDIDYYDD